MPETQPTAALPDGHTVWSCPTCAGPVATTWLFCESCGTDFRVSRPNRLTTPIPLQTAAPVVQNLPVMRAEPVPPARSPQTSSGLLERLRDGLADRLPNAPHLSADTGTALKALGGLLAVVLIGVAVTVHLQTRADLHRTERTLASAQEQLTGVRADLAANQAKLVSTKGDLADETAKLDETQGSLEDANDRLNLQNDQIDDLKSCLGGVQAAFSYFLNDSFDSALNELYAVEASCDRAYALF
ncbi:hypothetical protein LWF15_00260 [Kineosporia rhizophila]|uniref:coiled-coil domain-containing protein n=1 Tax=Kineosporia rhizophila TaxID=84633 RepID=UPI000A8D749E|nr:hypothetical protein [Kineosporia rhizophila]MCE0533937.1 hypothetical protein [Kineosporia rhizophila]